MLQLSTGQTQSGDFTLTLIFIITNGFFLTYVSTLLIQSQLFYGTS